MKRQLHIRGSIWLEMEKDLQIGKGRYQLLLMIHKLGSIQGAVKSLNISYRKAWSMVKEMNNKAPKPLIMQKAGGKYGGGAVLTTSGLQMKNTYEQLSEAFEQFKKKTEQIFLNQ